MASNTNNLGLLKKDPVADGNDTFNIRTMLNENWDKIDEFAGKTTPISKGGTGATTAAQALANLGGIAACAVGNLHVWERVQTYADPVPEVPAGYTLGEVETDVTAVSVNTTSPGAIIKSVLVYYANEPTVYSNGNLSIDTGNEVYINSTNYNEIAKLKGKFISVGGIGQQVNETDLIKGVIYYIPSDSIITYSNDNPCWVKFSKIQRVTGYPYTPAIPAGTTTDYLTSTDRNAYPDNVTDAQDAYYTLGDVVVKQMAMSSLAATTKAISWAYADSISVAEDGTISLQSPRSRTIQGNESYFVDYAKEFIGKFAICYSDGSSFTESACYFFPSDATVINNSTEFGGMPTVQMSKYQPVTGHAAIPANTTITYLGQLGDGARIEVGSYVGTGTESADILLGFTPKAVLVTANTSFYDSEGHRSAFILPGLPNESKVKRAEIIDGGFRVYYYSGGNISYSSYLNYSGSTFRYIAIK